MMGECSQLPGYRQPVVSTKDVSQMKWSSSSIEVSRLQEDADVLLL